MAARADLAARRARSASAIAGASRPSSAFASAAASFTAASASMSAGNSRSGMPVIGEVLQRAQRLHAVQRVVGHVALAEQVVLRARACAAEAERAPAAHERGVHGGEPLLDGARGASDERGVERRRLLEHVVAPARA